MASGNMEIHVKVNAEELTEFTRVKCVELDCIHNMGHAEGVAHCRLKQIYILKTGKCEQYEQEGN
jgi:hypothetical protein